MHKKKTNNDGWEEFVNTWGVIIVLILFCSTLSVLFLHDAYVLSALLVISLSNTIYLFFFCQKDYFDTNHRTIIVWEPKDYPLVFFTFFSPAQQLLAFILQERSHYLYSEIIIATTILLYTKVWKEREIKTKYIFQEVLRTNDEFYDQQLSQVSRYSFSKPKSSTSPTVVSATSTVKTTPPKYPTVQLSQNYSYNSMAGSVNTPPMNSAYKSTTYSPAEQSPYPSINPKYGTLQSPADNLFGSSSSSTQKDYNLFSPSPSYNSPTINRTSNADTSITPSLSPFTDATEKKSATPKRRNPFQKKR